MPVLVLVKSVSDTLPDCQTRLASLVMVVPLILPPDQTTLPVPPLLPPPIN